MPLQRSVRSINDLVKMKDEDRRVMLRNLSDQEYRNVINVLAAMPLVKMEVTTEGMTGLLLIYMYLSVMW